MAFEYEEIRKYKNSKKRGRIANQKHTARALIPIKKWWMPGSIHFEIFDLNDLYSTSGEEKESCCSLTLSQQLILEQCVENSAAIHAAYLNEKRSERGQVVSIPVVINFGATSTAAI